MSKALKQLETRLERLEKELADVKAALARRPGIPWYRQIVADFAGDDASVEIIRLGRLARRRQRQRESTTNDPEPRRPLLARCRSDS